MSSVMRLSRHCGRKEERMLDRILAILRWPIDVILMFLGVTAAYLHDLEMVAAKERYG